MKTSAAKQLIADFRAYDNQRDKQMAKLQRVLERTLDDLKSLNGGAPKRRRRRRAAE